MGELPNGDAVDKARRAGRGFQVSHRRQELGRARPPINLKRDAGTENDSQLASSQHVMGNRRRCIHVRNCARYLQLTRSKPEPEQHRGHGLVRFDTNGNLVPLKASTVDP